MKRWYVLSFVFSLFCRHSFAQLEVELIPNGSFSELDDRGWAVGWPRHGSASVKEDGGGRYLFIDGTGGPSLKIPIQPEYGRLKLAMKMKVENVVQGDESWQTGRLTMSFHDSNGKMVGGWPNVFGFVGTTEWMDCEREYAVPQGAAELRLSTTNLGKSGQVMFRELSLQVSRLRATAPSDLPVPEGVPGDPESLEDAWKQSTQTREKICLNGLWRFRPALDADKEGAVPAAGSSWGWFKVPGIWPNSVSEFDTGVQEMWVDPWIEENMGLKPFDRAWYKRTLTAPEEWRDRRVVLEFTMLQTHAQAFVDGKPAGSLWYPGGELDLTDHLVPGRTSELALLVTARPVSKEKLTFMAPDRVFKDKASVRLKGITGDLYLCSMPKQERLKDLQVITSVEKRTISFAAETGGLKPGDHYLLKARVSGVVAQDSRFVGKSEMCDTQRKTNLESGTATPAERTETARTESRPPTLRSDAVNTTGGANLLPRHGVIAKREDGVGRNQNHAITFESSPVGIDADGKLTFESSWKDAKLWDTHTPENLYSVVLQLCAKDGTLIDELTPVQFGFREFRIAGRDFLLNNIPMHLRLLHNRSTTERADVANEQTSPAMCRRMQEYGFNALIFGNYDFSPGTVAYIDGLLNACDKEGMLVCCSLPHMKDFDSKVDDPEVAQRYREITEWLIRRVRNHPSVIMYAMNHNACGYYGDQNPLKIDGRYELQVVGDSSNKWRKQSRDKAMITDAIAKSIDATRPVYHHQSGHLGDMHTVNIYLNWAPVQERSEWLRHWSAEGVKPLFFVEWGLPHISSWSSYRGPKFIWRTEAFQSLWAAEYAAQFYGDAAYRDDAVAVRALDHEEKLWATGKPFHWGNLNAPLRDMSANYLGVQTLFASENWRAHRAWGISAMLPWDQEGLWTRTESASAFNVTNALHDLKRPGIRPDRLGEDQRFLYARDGDENFVASPLGRAFLRWNMPECAFIGGGDDFTSKDHAYSAGEVVRKNLVILNDRREPQRVQWHWRLWSRGIVIKEDNGSIRVDPGSQRRIPVAFVVPPELTDGSFLNLTAVFHFEDGIIQTDQFGIDVVKWPVAPRLNRKIYLYDTKGHTAKLFDRLNVRHTKFNGSASELSELGYRKESEKNNAKSKTVAGDLDPGLGHILVIGRESLTAEGLPWIKSLPAGVPMLVFEQSSSVLEDLIGFRIAERGMRTHFVRYPHIVADLVGSAGFRDWRGEATLIPPFLEDLPQSEDHNPLWQWCGFTNTRVWRCGNRGNVASVVIEKPQRGDWRALLDCGFDLQYSPLLECVDNSRRIIFCQLDVTGRTEPEPVADRLVVNLLAYLDRAGVEPVSDVNAVGENAKSLLDDLGVKHLNGSLRLRASPLRRDAAGASPSQKLPQGQRSEGGRESFRAENLGLKEPNILVADNTAEPPENLQEMVGRGLKVLCLGMDSGHLSAWSPVPVTGVDTNACFERIEELSKELRGLSNADWAWHGRMRFDEVTMDNADNFYGSQALRVIHYGKGCVIFCQVPPWKMDAESKPYLRTSKRAACRLVSRILANLGASFETPLMERFAKPVEKAWLNSYYLDVPVAEDDPYRYYRW